MNHFMIFALGLISVCSETRATEFPRYPHGLLTQSYGVVTEDDLAFDARDYEIERYDSKTLVNGPYWQCMDPHQVGVTYRSWNMEEHEGRHETNCTVEFRVRVGSSLQIFTDRRGLPVSYCKRVISMWKRLIKDQPVVCLNGSGSMPHQDQKEGNYALWNWEKFKTKNGCYSYFARQCSTKGCAQGKCPRS